MADKAKKKDRKKQAAKGVGAFVVAKKALGSVTKVAALVAVGAAVMKILRRGR